MHESAFAEHLTSPRRRGSLPDGGADGIAGGAACGDLIRIALRLDGERVSAIGFEAEGCGAMIAAGSAAATLVEGAALLDAARIGATEIAAELGGLSPGKVHAAELAADALARALGGAARQEAALAPVEERTLVAMSGGVDSAVAALLCARGGEAVAATLELWRDPANDGERSCCSAQAVRGARALAHRMGLPHLTIDLRDEFTAGVVEPFLADHRAGLTPNPCVRCNGHVRLDALLDLSTRLGAATLATGHYARIQDDGDGPLIARAADPAKDQSYVLGALAPASVARMRFPLGGLTKPEVREIAAREGLPVAQRPDSQDLCFLAGTGRAAFLARHGGMRDEPGPILDRTGRRIGRHRGHRNYTVGQRRGLGIGGGEPRYVLGTDAAANAVVVGRHADLRTDQVALRDVTLHRDPALVDAVKLRYRSEPVACRLDGETVRLHEPVAGAAPGQAAVLLAGERVVGHAWIAPPAPSVRFDSHSGSKCTLGEVEVVVERPPPEPS